MKQNTKTEGFALIELLLVISIIGFLATTAVFATNTARVKAQDARRISDLKKISQALELYYSDNGRYPPINAATSGSTDPCIFLWCDFQTALAPYMQLPLDPDPVGGGWPYSFYYDADIGDNYQTYGLMVKLVSPGNMSLAGSDGGEYPTIYETGPQLAYCTKYQPLRWWGVQTTVCAQGN